MDMNERALLLALAEYVINEGTDESDSSAVEEALAKVKPRPKRKFLYDLVTYKDSTLLIPKNSNGDTLKGFVDIAWGAGHHFRYVLWNDQVHQVINMGDTYEIVWAL